MMEELPGYDRWIELQGIGLQRAFKEKEPMSNTGHDEVEKCLGRAYDDGFRSGVAQMVSQMQAASDRLLAALAKAGETAVVGDAPTEVKADE